MGYLDDLNKRFSQTSKSSGSSSYLDTLKSRNTVPKDLQNKVDPSGWAPTGVTAKQIDRSEGKTGFKKATKAVGNFGKAVAGQTAAGFTETVHNLNNLFYGTLELGYNVIRQDIVGSLLGDRQEYDITDTLVGKDAVNGKSPTGAVGKGLDWLRQGSNQTTDPVTQKLDKWSGLENQNAVVQGIAGGFRSSTQTAMALIPVVGMGLMTASSFQQNLESKYDEAVTRGEKPDPYKLMVYAAGSAAIDYATERLNNIGRAFQPSKTVMVAAGGRPQLAKGVTGFFREQITPFAEDLTKPTIKEYVKFLGQQAMDEGMEEVYSALATGVLAKWTTDPDAKLYSMYEQDGGLISLDGTMKAFLGGATLGFLMPAINTGVAFKRSRDYILGTLGAKSLNSVTDEEMKQVLSRLRRDAATPEGQEELAAKVQDAATNMTLTGQQLLYTDPSTGEQQVLKTSQPDAQGNIAIKGAGTLDTISQDELAAGLQTGLLTPATPASAVTDSSLPATNGIPQQAGVAPQVTLAPTADGQGQYVTNAGFKSFKGGKGSITATTNGKTTEITIQSPDARKGIGRPAPYSFTVDNNTYLQQGDTAEAKAGHILGMSGQNGQAHLGRYIASSVDEKSYNDFYRSLTGAIDTAIGQHTTSVQQQAAAKEAAKAKPAATPEPTPATEPTAQDAAPAKPAAKQGTSDRDLARKHQARLVAEGKGDAQTLEDFQAMDAEADRIGKKGFYNEAQPNKLTAKHKAVQSILEKATGKQVIFMYGVNGEFANEFVPKTTTTRIYVNANIGDNTAWALGHGLYHTVDNEGLGEDFAAAVLEQSGKTKQELIDGYINKYKSSPKYQQSLRANPEATFKEAVADRCGEVFSSREFLQKFSDRVGESKFNRLIDKIKDWLSSVRDISEREVDALLNVLAPYGDKNFSATVRKPTAEGQAKADEIKADRDKRIDGIKNSNWDSETKSRMIKATGYQAAAEMREAIQGDSVEPIEGGLNAVELAAKRARLDSYYHGKPVTVDGKPATITATPFGNVTVQFEDGSKKTVSKDQVKPAIQTVNGVEVDAKSTELITASGVTPDDPKYTGEFSVISDEEQLKRHMAHLSPAMQKEAKALFNKISELVNSGEDYQSAFKRMLITTQEVGKGPFRKNSGGYIWSLDFDTTCTCTRVLDYANYVNEITKRLGRPMTKDEMLTLVFMMRSAGVMIPCVYCYVESKRQIKSDAYNNLARVKQAVMEGVQSGKYQTVDEAYADLKAVMYGSDDAIASLKVFERWFNNSKGHKPTSAEELHRGYNSALMEIMGLLDEKTTQDQLAKALKMPGGEFNTLYLKANSPEKIADFLAKQYGITKKEPGSKTLSPFVMANAKTNDEGDIKGYDEEGRKVNAKTGAPVKQEVNEQTYEYQALKNVVQDWLYDHVAGNSAHSYAIFPDQAMKNMSHDGLRQYLGMYAEAINYMNAASSAKKVEQYAQYIDQVFDIPVKDKMLMIARGGGRIHSSNDARFDHYLDYIAAFNHFAADKRGPVDPATGKMKEVDWFLHAYTKDLAWADFFGGTNTRINVSLAATTIRDENGKVIEIRANTSEGAEWGRAQALRAKYKDVGTMFMAVDNDQLLWALDQPWIDMIIPFHASGMTKEVFHDLMRYIDYTQTQRDMPAKRNFMVDQLSQPAALAAHGLSLQQVLDLNKEPLEKLYAQYGYVHEVEGKMVATPIETDYLRGDNGNLVHPEFLPYEYVENGVTVPGHGNSAETMMDLCKRFGVQPRFYDLWMPSDDGEIIRATDHPNYVKLIKETARTDSEQQGIVNNFDPEKLERLMREHAEAGGYTSREEYQGAKSDPYGIVDTFMSYNEVQNEDGSYTLDKNVMDAVRGKENEDYLREALRYTSEVMAESEWNNRIGPEARLARSGVFPGWATPADEAKAMAQKWLATAKGQKDYEDLTDEQLTRMARDSFGVNFSIMPDDYRMNHRAPNPDENAPLHELTENGIYPDDVYSSNGVRYYGVNYSVPGEDYKTQRILKSLRGEPDAEVTIFRSVPVGVDKINPGDWVALTKTYAENHGLHIGGDNTVISATVKAKELYTNGDSWSEWGYWPEDATVASVAFSMMEEHATAARLFNESWLSKDTLDQLTDAHRFYKAQSNSRTLKIAAAKLKADPIGAQALANDITRTGALETALRLYFMFESDLKHDDSAAAHWALVAVKSAKNAGQGVQAYKMVARLSPQGTLLMINREINSLLTDEEQAKVERLNGRLADQLADENRKRLAEALPSQEELEELLTMREGRAKQLEKRLADMEADLKIYEGHPVRQFMEALHAIVEATVPFDQIPKTDKMTDFLRWAINNPLVTEKMWEMADQAVKNLRMCDSEFIAEIDAYFRDFLPKTKRVPQLTQRDYAQILGAIKAHYLTNDQSAATLVRRLQEIGIHPGDATLIADKVNQQLNLLTKRTRIKMLKRIVPLNAKDTRGKLAKIINLANEKGMQNEDVQAAIAQMLGLPAMSSDQQAEVMALSKEIQAINILANKEGRLLTEEEQRAVDFRMAQILARLNAARPVRLLDKVDTFRAMMMLSMLKSAERNIIGNFLFASVDIQKDFLAAAIDRISAAAGGTYATVPLPSFKAALYGARKGLRYAIEDIQAGVDTGLLDTQFGFQRGEVFTNPVGKWAMRWFRYKMSLPDRVFQTAAYEAYLQGLQKLNAKRPAEAKLTKAEMETAALEYAARKTFTDDNAISRFFSGLQKQLNFKYFHAGSMIMPFVKVPGALVMRTIEYSPVSLVRALYYLGKFNSMKYISRDAQTAKETWQKTDQKKFALALADGTFGTAMTITMGFVLRALGLISGEPPEDPKEKNMRTVLGFSPYGYQMNWSALRRWLAGGMENLPEAILAAVTLGDAADLIPVTCLPQEGDLLTNYNWISPMSLGMSIGANYMDATRLLKGQSDDKVEQFYNLAMLSVMSGTESLATQSFMSGVASLLNTQQYTSNITYVDGEASRNPYVLEAIVNVAVSYPTSFLHNGLKVARDILDDKKRTTYDRNYWEYAWNLMKNRIPGLSSTLAPKYDNLGNIQYTYGTEGAARIVDLFINPAFSARVRLNESAMLVLNIMQAKKGTNVENKNVTPATMKRYINYTKPDGTKARQELTNHEQAELQRVVGQRLQDYFTILNPEMSLEETVKAMNSAINDITDEETSRILDMKRVVRR